jgi:predicted permease
VSLFVSDVRYSLRQLSLHRGFAITVMLTLALGIGANVAIFSIVDAVLLRPLPYRNPDRLVVVWQTDATHRGTGAWFDAYREFEEWQQGSHSFEKLAALTWATSGKILVWNGKPMGLFAVPASSDFFSLLAIPAQIGRTFSRNDLNNPCTLVLAYPFWKEKLGAPGDIAGQTLMVDRSPCVVAGVMPKSFSFYPKEANAWSLITPASEFVQQPWTSMTGVFGLLKPGVTRAQAEAELTALERRIVQQAPASLGLLTTSVPIALDLKDNFTWLAGRNLRSGLWVLLGAVAIILVMACLNVANLLLGRGIERAHEMAVRTALGSGRARLMRQMLTESLLLALGGTGAGILLATLLIHWFRSVNPVELPPGSAVSLSFPVLLFAATLGAGSVLIFGLFPAWRSSEVDLNAALKDKERSTDARGGARSTSRTLVVLQIALSLMLFVGAGLLAASLWRMASTPLGYRTDHILTGKIDLPREADADAKSRFAAAFAQKVSVLPGVAAMTEASEVTPMGENPLCVEGDPSRYSAGGVASQAIATNFFDVMRIPFAQGRIFDSRDRRETQPVAIVNLALANKYFPHVNPIGSAIKLSRADDPSEPWLTIIGVVADIRTTTVFQEMGYIEQPTVYRPLSQAAPASLALMVVADGSPMGLVAGIEEQLASLDRELVLSGVATMNDRESAMFSQPRFRTVLFGSFALLALVLAAIGLYGLLAQMVGQRRRQLAIRMALGASRGRVLSSVLREALALTAIGIGLGIVGSAIGVRVLAGLLYDTRAESTGMFVLCSVVLLLTAFVASWYPAWRAANIDPIQTLRTE